jgi:Ca2+-binding EF-hand superfamily protein
LDIRETAMADEYLKNPLWVHRMEMIFPSMDRNKSGYLEREDWELWINNLEKASTNPDPALMDNLRKALYEYCDGLGLKKGTKLLKDEFIRNAASFIASERAKKKRGEEEPLIFKLNNALFDMVDTNHDGTISLDEFRVIMTACNQDPGTAEATFRIMDTNKNNRIERQELNEHQFNFWCDLDDPKSKGMMGAKFETK